MLRYNPQQIQRNLYKQDIRDALETADINILAIFEIFGITPAKVDETKTTETFNFLRPYSNEKIEDIYNFFLDYYSPFLYHNIRDVLKYRDNSIIIGVYIAPHLFNKSSYLETFFFGSENIIEVSNPLINNFSISFIISSSTKNVEISSNINLSQLFHFFDVIFNINIETGSDCYKFTLLTNVNSVKFKRKNERNKFYLPKFQTITNAIICSNENSNKEIKISVSGGRFMKEYLKDRLLNITLKRQLFSNNITVSLAFPENRDYTIA